MMLLFHETPEYYIITEHMLSWTDTKTTITRYKKDLSEVQVNKDPWRSVDEKTKEWFEKLYRPYFNGEKNGNS